jgi:MYXO-CTERM domain-containing protein
MIFRTSSWCELLADGTCAIAIGAYDQAALAVTSVVATKSTGEIRDADIEINGFHHQWADLVAHPDVLATEPQTQDLQNALTHEMGHLIGLDHTCWPGPTSGMVDPIDNLGNPVPECNAASADIQATTMFPSAVNGDIQKRTLAPDDQLAVCEIYPAADDPKICAPNATPGGCNCSFATDRAASAQDIGLVVLASLASLLLLAMRRRPATARGARG